jgi:thermitase
MNIKNCFFASVACLALALTIALPASAATPNDPRFNAQWHLKKIGAPAAWDVTTGSKEVVVAVLDTGVDYKDPDLAANMWRNSGETGLDANGNDKTTNGIDDDGNGYIDDLYGIDVVHHDSDPIDPGRIRGSVVPVTHGTGCAGLIGSVGNNAIGTVGVAWTVSIMAIRVYPFDPQTEWNDRKVAAGYTEAFRYVRMMKQRGVNIVACNMSLGLSPYSQELKDAIDACGREGVLSVFIAGNDSLNLDQVARYPGSYNSRSVITVAGTGADDALTYFSGYGKSTAHLAAPAINLVTTDYSDFTGTSGAAPQVAGAIALLKSAVPQASSWDIKAAILGSVDQPATLSGKITSNGRLNVAKALARLTNAAAPTIVIAAHPAGPRTRAVDPVQITFSRPMNRTSVEGAVSFTPTTAGHFEWENEDRTVTFIPDLPLVHTNYTAKILGSALDGRGNTLDGNYNGVRQDSPVDDYKWTFSFPVPNDDFANALPLTGDAGNQKGTTRNASPELDEPFVGNDRTSSSSVWFRWTAPRSGWFTFDTLKGTSFDSLLSVYTGNQLDSLNELTGNDDHGTSPYSRASFAAVEGASYSIAVAGKSYAADRFLVDETLIGPFTLNWYPTPPPGFTGLQFSPASGAPGVKVTLVGTNLAGATGVLFNGVIATFSNALTNNTDLKITAVVPSEATSGAITIVTPHGSVTSANSFTVLRPQLSLRQSAADQLEIVWSAASTKFILEESETMRSGSWTVVSESPVVANGVYKVTLPVSVGQRFFRARQQ